ncbi:calcium incorporation protein MxaA [Verminephrobacter eiseniae]|uniref:calcium incorporation protein MxaA n=1 Tax=Verminephrobacter eiseniae TaxID=364317 RepID=UPI00223736DE|nr:calcium incorporation protein MxaA [Verminephrobacter eiseniae]
MSAARPPEGAHTVAEGEGAPSFAARPPEGAHTAAEGEGAPSFAARPPEGAHTVAEGEGAPVRRRRQRLVRLAGAAACATLAAMPPCPARAQTHGSRTTGVTGGVTGGVRVGGPIVQPPRAFGYQLGDLVTQRLLLPADGRRLETAALPRAERISGWLERRPFQWETDAEGRQWLLASYQIVNAPQTLTAIVLPALSLPMSAGPALKTDAQLISVGPLTPQTVLGKGGLLDIRPDRPASVAPSAPIARRLRLWLLALASTLAAWMGWWAWRHRRESRHLPFARAWRRLRQLDPDQSEAWLCLHQALNETAATVLRAPALPGLLARAPHLQPLHAQLQHFYACSDQRFFSGQPAGAPFPLRAFCRALYLAEKQARS